MIYEDFIKFHALRILEGYLPNLIGYIEVHGGPLMTYYIHHLGPDKVINDLHLKIIEESDAVPNQEN